ncbi:acetylserotonin O-methyltransferase [Streptomyces gobiensis]|uniref:acetylserotonin O-methyltransferase n=1 Tax=Streptomyces gobiensis TaxID=2875706 RepID=UPI001E470415|nr:acetylserotonin O-methyltransferase [Streptomyces gobiensis]UGY93756.1 acetylserotonin O-methyltransferase [Streptomyces gobiensis]
MADDSRGPDGILELATGFMAAKTLLSAVELGLFSRLGNGPVTGDRLRDELGLAKRSARDFFDALVSLGMLERHGDTYANTPDTARYLDRASPDYLGGWLEMLNERLYGFWGQLTTGLRTGLPQNEAAGRQPGETDFFGELYSDPQRLRDFQRAMSGLSARSVDALAQAVDWRGYRTVCDVGSAQGALLAGLLTAHPQLRGVGFDLPAVGPVLTEYVRERGLADRVDFVPGDFFTDPLPRAEVLIFGHILHDWDLPTKRMLLEKAYEALPEGGMVVLYETLIDDERRVNTAGLLMSLNMLIETPGGFDYTGADAVRWLTDTGFHNPRVVPLTARESAVTAIR